MLSQNSCWRCDEPEITGKAVMCTSCRLAKYCSVKCLLEDEVNHKMDCENASVRLLCYGCKKKGLDMKQCANCLTTWFCSKECMVKSWKYHKSKCLTARATIAEVYQKLQSRFNTIIHIADAVYYWGNTPAVDLINLPMNEGDDYTGPLKLLMCGVGDPRSVCLSLASLPEEYNGQVTFVLNDRCSFALARVALLLYLIIKGGISKANAVTQIWYSLHLTTDSHAFLVSALQDLTRISNLEVITHGVMQVSADDLRKLKWIWGVWLSLANQHLGLQQQRKDAVKRCEKTWKTYCDDMPSKLKKSAQEWLQNGVLQSGDPAKSLIHENVSLTGLPPSCMLAERGESVKTFHYCVPDASHPFKCWDYKDAVKALPDSDSLQDIYSRYITSVVQGAARRLEGSVIIKCIFGDCMDLPREIPDGLHFDRITTSNLCDYIRLPSLLDVCSPLLNKSNPCSVILTEAMIWSKLFPEIFSRDVYRHDPRDIPDDVLKQANIVDPSKLLYMDVSNAQKPDELTNYMGYFRDYLRACLLPPSQPLPKFMPSLKKLAGDQGLILRDPALMENRIAPFRYDVNCRRPTNVQGRHLTVEWVLIKSP